MIPREVLIQGVPYKVRRRQMKDYGICDYTNKMIYLKTGMSKEMAEETFLHECIHAILYQSGIGFHFDEKMEESVVRSLEHGLIQAGFRWTGGE